MLELPFPPSILSPNVTAHWTVKYKAFKKYKGDCIILAKQVKPMIKFRISFFPPDKRRRDRDNVIAAFKAGQDGLAQAWGMDDSQFEITYAPLGEPVKFGKVLIEPV